LLTIAGLWRNLWIYCTTLLVRRTVRRGRPAARQRLDATLRLDRCRDLLLDAIKAIYHARDALHYPSAEGWSVSRWLAWIHERYLWLQHRGGMRMGARTIAIGARIRPARASREVFLL
jgi:hypothetical protein